MSDTFKAVVAEFVGTFGLVFVSAGALVADMLTDQAIGLVGVALATASAYAMMVMMTMNISGGHINPAVTAALWLAKKIDGRIAGSYITTQLLAAASAALVLSFLFPTAAAEATSLGSVKISTAVTMPQAIVLEALMTFLLVSAVFGTIVSPTAPRVGGFGVGLALLFAMLVVGPLSGAALNPARAFGPALVSGDFEGHIAYWVGPLSGGLAAGLLWWKVLLPAQTSGPRMEGL